LSTASPFLFFSFLFSFSLILFLFFLFYSSPVFLLLASGLFTRAMPGLHNNNIIKNNVGLHNKQYHHEQCDVAIGVAQQQQACKVITLASKH
jgi:hypothetical protein